MGKIYLTADPHYHHANIIKYCNRPFGTYHQMDEALIKNHNSVVSNDDTVFFLGDFTLSRNKDVIEDYLSRLNGHKHLILGNHDEARPFTYVGCGFESVHTSYPLPEHNLIMVHDPSLSDACKALGYDKILCGHVHNLFEFHNGVLNVGVDIHDYKPISLERALEYFNVFFPEEEGNTDVHTEHCCVKHGCKYRDDECTVVNRVKSQSFPCEDCDSEEYFDGQ